MITSTELKIFRLLLEPSDMSWIARRLELSISAISRCISNSIRKPDNGLFEKERVGKGVEVRRADTQHAQVLSTVFNEFANQPLERLLSDNRMRILGVMLGSEKPPKDLAHILQITREYVSKCLGELARHGFVVKKGHGYKANPQNKLIADFVRSYYDYKDLHIARTLAADSTLLWNRSFEFLFKTNVKITENDAKMTAVSRFPDYELPLISNTNYYFYTLRKLDVSDVIIHTFLIDPGSPLYNAYACLLYQKMKPANLMNVAKLYGVAEHVNTLLCYLEKHEKVPWLFSWDEYEELARDYRVLA